MKEPIRESIVHHAGLGAFSLRKGKWKIIFGKGEVRVHPLEGEGYLYDLQIDPYEKNDRWEQNLDVVAELTALMNQYKNGGRTVSLR